MLAVIPDDYDRAYVASPHLERLRARGDVRVHTEPPRDDAELLTRLAPAPIRIPIRERTPLTAARLAGLPALRLTTHETLDRFKAGAVDNALAFLDGAPRNVVNPEALKTPSP